MQRNYEQTAVFLFGTVIGTSIGLILASLNSAKRIQVTPPTLPAPLKNKSLSSDDFSQRVQFATDTWVKQMRDIADDLVSQGRLTREEARTQMNELIHKLRA